MAKVFNRVAVATATTGTGTVTLGAAISAAFCTFAEAGVANADVITYLITEGTNFEIGRGTYTSSGTTLSRTTVLLSKISGTAGTSKISLGGAAEVRITAAAQDFTMGLQSIWIPAAAMIPQITNGPSVGLVEMATNKNMFRTLDFDPSTQEFAQFMVQMPPSWNAGTVTFVPVWSHPATSTNFGVVFGLAGVALSNDDAGDVAFGTPQTSTSTGGTTNDFYFGPTSASITIAGTVQARDCVMFQINRTVADGGDTLAVDARLHGVTVFYTINAANDA